MSKLIIGEQIRTLRKTKGLLAELLAEMRDQFTDIVTHWKRDGVVPRGETPASAQALDIPVEELAASEELSASVDEPSGFSMREDQGFLRLMNLSALSFWFILSETSSRRWCSGFLKGTKSLGNGPGKRILNFQITRVDLFFTALFVLAGCQGFSSRVLLWCSEVIALLYFGNTVFVFINTQK